MKPGDLVRHIHDPEATRDLGIVLQLFPGTAMYTKVYWTNHKLYGSHPVADLCRRKIGDMVKFVDGSIVGFIVGTTNAPDVIQVLWLCEPERPLPARIDRLEVISEGG